MKRIPIIFCFVYSQIIAQLPDSIAESLSRQATTNDKIFFLDSASNHSLRSNIDLHYLLVNEGLSLARRLDNDSLRCHFLIKLGINQVYQDQFDSARSIYKEVLTSTSSDYQQAISYSEIGVSYYYESNDAKALDNFIKSYNLWVDLKDTVRLAGITNNIGAVYRYLGDYEASNQYYQKAIYFKKLMGETVTLGSSLHNLGINYEELGTMDSARYYLNKARKIRELYQDKRGLAKTYNSLATIYLKTDRLDSSEYFYKKAVVLDKELNDQVALLSDQVGLAEVLTNQGAYAEAIDLANNSLNETDDVRVKLDALRILDKAYEGIGNYRMTSGIKDQLLTLKDSIYQAEKEASLQELRVTFETEQKESEIAQLSAENKIQRLQARQDAQTRIILIVVLVALVIIALLFYSRFKSKAKSNQLLDAKNRELAKLNSTKDRLFSIISHDLKSPLSSFHLITKSLADNLDNVDKAQLKEYLESLRDSSANVRDMMDNLLKWALTQTDQLGSKIEAVEVNKVLQTVVNQLNVVSNAKSVAIQTDLKRDLRLLGDTGFLEIVIRNLLSNSLKFTEAGKSIFVETQEKGDQAIFRVRDEGVGMDQEEVDKLLAGEIMGQEIQNSTEKGTGLGITLVKELVSKMDGQLNVTSSRGKGTTFEIVFKKAA